MNKGHQIIDFIIHHDLIKVNDGVIVWSASAPEHLEAFIEDTANDQNQCENCGKWIKDYEVDDDGLYFCKGCWEGLK